MKQYKVIKASAAEAFEIDLNELAKAGWKVITANLVFRGLESEEQVYFALLENRAQDKTLNYLLEENLEELDNIDLAPSDN